MDALTSLLRFLFWLLLISWTVRLVRRVFGWMFESGAPTTNESHEPARSASRRLVRDPVCGMHVDETLSIPLRVREGGELVHFCSLACRDAYTVSTKRLAANG